jgi:hypothetical protein
MGSLRGVSEAPARNALVEVLCAALQVGIATPMAVCKDHVESGSLLSSP